MSTQRRTAHLAAMAIGAVVVVGAMAAAEGGKLPSIFTGTDLAGWEVPADNIWWKASDGVLSVESGPEQKGSTLWTEKAYENFVMEFEFKLGEGTVDSGIYLRNSREQIQIGISGSLERDMTGSPYISGKGYPVEAEGVKELLKLDDWNEMTIVAKENNYAVWLNGAFVMTYDSDTAIEEGPIGIQLHGNRDMSIAFRNIGLAELM
ncbi:MAG: DUF1080 domain-containing protein [Candidatus Hydrogenedentota bacterium]